MENYKMGGVPKPGMPGKPPQGGKINKPAPTKTSTSQQKSGSKTGQREKLKEMAMKISQMGTDKQKKAIKQLAQKDKQVAKQVAQMVQQFNSGQQQEKSQGPEPSQARKEQRREFEKEVPGFEDGGKLPEYEDGGVLNENSQFDSWDEWSDYNTDYESWSDQYEALNLRKGETTDMLESPRNGIPTKHTDGAVKTIDTEIVTNPNAPKEADTDNLNPVKVNPSNKNRKKNSPQPPDDPLSVGNEEQPKNIGYEEQLVLREQTSNVNSQAPNSESTEGLSDSDLKKIGGISQIAPDVFGLLQASGKTDYMPRISNEKAGQSLSTMDEAIESMPEEYNIRAAEQRNESSYQQASDAMYRNTSSAPVARANVGSLFGKKMEASNKLNGLKNNKEAQYAQAEAQLMGNKAQMQSKLGSEDAQYQSAYERNKLKADAKRRALRQKYLANIGTKTAYNTRRELKSRRDMDQIRINQESHTDDVQMSMDKLIQLLE